MKNTFKSIVALAVLTVAAGKVNAQLASDAPAPAASTAKTVVAQPKTTTPPSASQAPAATVKAPAFDAKQNPFLPSEAPVASRTTAPNPAKLSVSTPESEKVFKPEEPKTEAKPSAEPTVTDKVKKQQ